MRRNRRRCAYRADKRSYLHLPATSVPGRARRSRPQLDRDAAPVDVLQVTVLAAADETDRRCFPTLTIVPPVFKALRGLEILKTGKSAPVRCVPSDCVAREPAREHRRLDAGRHAPWIARINWWRPQLRWPVGNEPPVVGQALMQEPRKPGLLDDMECARSEHFPVIEPLNEHRAFREIEHRAGTEYPDHLAK